MQVGDLVRFSAYGKKIQQNRNVAFYDPVGVVIRFSAPWFYISWCGLGELMIGPPELSKRRKYFRQDLKYAK